MTRGQIVDASYSAGLGLNAVKRDMGLVERQVADRTEQRIRAAQELSKKIDAIVGRGKATEADMDILRDSARELSESTVCEKEELDWSEYSIYASIPRMVSSLLRRK
jgi:hypothetical protein